MNIQTATFSIFLATATQIAFGVLAQDADATRRAEISARGTELFRNTSNHCHSFRDLATFASAKANGPLQLVDDLKFVLIGNSILDRRSGPYYIGRAPGATGDTGFKAELKDGSPQVEHAMAAIYLGRGILPPGVASAAAAFSEVVGGTPNAADAQLYLIGGDIGARMSASNYKEVPQVIDRTMCE